jgi:hypothetical protein
VPHTTIWQELVAMAGGVGTLVARAEHYLDRNAPHEALHFVEMALAVDADHVGVREAEVGVLEQLIELTEGRTYDELCWLETKRQEALDALASSARSARAKGLMSEGYATGNARSRGVETSSC